ncbi:MAG: hypothetical protein HQK53_12360 [Oligoflexia bacterium]|nr:hypothetical protein [Oligoflexia bacterium]
MLKRIFKKIWKRILGKFGKKDSDYSSDYSNDCKGQGMIEYVIVASLIALLCLGMMRDLGAVLKKRVEDLRKQIVANIP